MSRYADIDGRISSVPTQPAGERGVLHDIGELACERGHRVLWVVEKGQQAGDDPAGSSDGPNHRPRHR